MTAGIKGMIIISYIAMVVAILPPHFTLILSIIAVVVSLSSWIMSLYYERQKEKARAAGELEQRLDCWQEVMKEQGGYPSGGLTTIQPLPPDRETVAIPSLDELLETDKIFNNLSH